MTDEIKLTDDGFVPVTINETTVEIDLYAVHNRLLDIGRECEGDGEDGAPKADENALIARYVESLGFPRVSHRAAVKFANAIFARVEDVRKKDESAASPSPNAASQSSTGSPSSD